MAFTKKFITNRKIQLLQEKENLEEELMQVAKKSKHEKDGYLPRYIDLGSKQDENIQEVADFSNIVSIEKEVETSLKEVNEALEKIKKNIYGFCEKCKKQISQKRLEAFPAADLCIKCKKLES
jgi:DnaK suppressor protein